MIKIDNPGKNFLEFCKGTVDFTKDNDLFLKFDRYIGVILPSISHTFLSHKYLPQAYGIELESIFSKNVYKKLQENKKLLPHRRAGFFAIDGINIFPIQNLSKKIDFIIAFGDVSIEEKNVLRQLCEYLQLLHHIFIKQRASVEYAGIDKQANLLSQVTHDFNSLITLIKEEQFSNDIITKKVAYSEKLMHDLIFYIRDLDIYKSVVPIKELLEGILSEVYIPEDIELQFSIDHNLGKISVDVELINKALSLVLENTTRAASQRGKKVMFRVQKRDTVSIFFKCSWLEMTITDNGPGIPDEFMPMITEPFFTTFKDQGCTGFGLPLVQKVIDAHDGLLTLEQNNPRGIKVTIHLPLKN